MTEEHITPAAEYIHELRGLQHRYIAQTINHLRQDARLPKYFFRVSGVLIILCSVSIPFVSSISMEDYPWKDTLLSILALSLAALSSLNSFFRWGEEWRSLRQTDALLVSLSAQWETQIANALNQRDHEKAKQLAYEATQTLMNRATEAMNSMTTEYFKGIILPTPTPPTDQQS
jgi:hypothetical protein